MSDIQLVVSNFLSLIKEYLDCILRFQITSTQNEGTLPLGRQQLFQLNSLSNENFVGLKIISRYFSFEQS